VSSGLNISTSDLTENIRIAEQTFKQLKCPLLEVIVNRIDPENILAIRAELKEHFAAGLSISFLPIDVEVSCFRTASSQTTP
jgi:BioD-like phosphotransacetylase family protein